jgi:hypothetical protein
MVREGSMPGRAKSWGCNGGAAPLAKIVWYYHTHLAVCAKRRADCPQGILGETTESKKVDELKHDPLALVTTSARRRPHQEDEE